MIFGLRFHLAIAVHHHHHGVLTVLRLHHGERFFLFNLLALDLFLCEVCWELNIVKGVQLTLIGLFAVRIQVLSYLLHQRSSHLLINQIVINIPHAHSIALCDVSLSV